MNDSEHLPEDLELIPGKWDEGRLSVSARIGKQHIWLSAKAHEALGIPSHIEVLFGTQSRVLAFRPTQNGGRKLTHIKATGAVQIQAADVIARLPLPPAPANQSHKFPARLVEGALLIGPLPMGEGSRD